MFNLFKKPKGTGALIDDRPIEAKLKDIKFEEIVISADPVNWIEKPREQWRKFPIYNQNGSGSCVAQTLAKLLGILYWLKNGVYVHFSATDIYQRRANKPAAGMAGVDAFDIARNGGVTLEVLVPSQEMTDAQMDAVKVEPYKRQVGEIFKVPNYVQLPLRDIDTVASVIEKTGKALMTWYFFDIPEWTEQPTIKNPSLDLYAPSTNRHSVAAVDWTLYKGKKAIIIDDSWGSSYGLAGQRIITEDFFKARNFFVAYPINFKFDEADQVTPKPKYQFTKDLKFSPTFFVDVDVIALQDILKYEGFFPVNVDSTGYYGSLSSKGVLAWQKKHNIAPINELEELQGRIVGKKTRQALNALYGS